MTPSAPATRPPGPALTTVRGLVSAKSPSTAGAGTVPTVVWKPPAILNLLQVRWGLNGTDARSAREPLGEALGRDGVLGQARLDPAGAGLRLRGEDRRERVAADVLDVDAEGGQRVAVDRLRRVAPDRQLADVGPHRRARRGDLDVLAVVRLDGRGDRCVHGLLVHRGFLLLLLLVVFVRLHRRLLVAGLGAHHGADRLQVLGRELVGEKLADLLVVVLATTRTFHLAGAFALGQVLRGVLALVGASLAERLAALIGELVDPVEHLAEVLDVGILRKVAVHRGPQARGDEGPAALEVARRDAGEDRPEVDLRVLRQAWSEILAHHAHGDQRRGRPLRLGRHAASLLAVARDARGFSGITGYGSLTRCPDLTIAVSLPLHAGLAVLLEADRRGDGRRVAHVGLLGGLLLDLGEGVQGDRRRYQGLVQAEGGHG